MTSRCTRCRWHNNPKNINCVPYFGPPNPKIVMIGEAWGQSEADNYIMTGNAECFVGKAGEKLNELLEIAGIRKEEIGLINSLRCWQPDNATPTIHELDQCFIYLFLELQKLRPQLVVAMGDSAVYQCLNRRAVGANRKKLIWSDKIQCKTVVTFHPASLLYDNSKYDDLVDDFKLIPTLIDKEASDYKKFAYKVIENIDEARNVIKFLSDKELFFDTESSGLDPFNDDLRLIQLGDSSSEIIYLMDFELAKSVKDELKQLFESVPVSGQAFSQDVKFLFRKLGIFPKNWKWDTCLADYVLDGMRDNDLTYLVGKYVPEAYGYDDEIMAQGGAHKVKDKEVLYQYAANDVGVLPTIKRSQHRQLFNNDMLWLYENIVMPTNKILTKMSLRGVLIDVEKVKEIDKMYEKRAGRALLKAMSVDGIKECEKRFNKTFNPRSSDMVRWLLLDYYKLPVLQKTRKENPSVGQKEMEIYARKYHNPYCEIMEAYRSYKTLQDNFLSGLLPKLHDGVAHTTYSLHATTTGRSNSRDPNLLNLPRDKEIKQCFIARPNHKFVYADFAQLEMRVAAMWYNDESLKAICNDITKDIHSQVTAQAFGKTYEEVYNGYKSGDPAMTELRVFGKTIGFGILYQEGDDALAYQLNISKEKAAKLKESFYNNFPELRGNIENTKQLVVKQGYLDNYFHFRRKWKFHSETDHSTLREAVNFPIQSLGFNFLELALIEIDKELYERSLKSELILQVYDSICVEATEEEVEEVSEIVRDIMQNINKPFDGVNDVRLVSDIKVGNNLGEL